MIFFNNDILLYKKKPYQEFHLVFHVTLILVTITDIFIKIKDVFQEIEKTF